MLNEAFTQVDLDPGMTQGGIAGMSNIEAEPESYIVESRYGPLTFTPDQVVTMGKSVLGFPHLTRFGLAKLPSQQDGTLVLMQSLEEAGTSFPCFGLDLHNPLIEEKDLLATLESLSIKPEDCAILSILTVREEAGKTVMSINLRAPIFVDSSRRMAWQVVLSNPRYPIRHTL